MAAVEATQYGSQMKRQLLPLHLPTGLATAFVGRTLQVVGSSFFLSALPWSASDSIFIEACLTSAEEASRVRMTTSNGSFANCKLPTRSLTTGGSRLYADGAKGIAGPVPFRRLLLPLPLSPHFVA